MVNNTNSTLGGAPEHEPRLDRVFLALSDASRRRVLARLANGSELSVGDASADLTLSPAGITKHIKVLEDAGLVRRRLDGRRHLLSIEEGNLLLARDWIDRYHALWADSLGRLADLAAELEAAADADEEAGR